MAAIEYDITPSPHDSDVWMVEGIDYDRDGQVYVAIFSGPYAEERAREYVSLMEECRPLWRPASLTE